MRRLILLIAILLSFVAQDSYASNILSNPGFEYGNSTNAMNWTEGGTGGRTIDCGRNGVGDWCLDSPDVTPVVSDSYTASSYFVINASAYIKGVSTSATITIEESANNVDWSTLSGCTKSLTSTASYQQLTTGNCSISNNYVRVKLVGIVKWDDINMSSINFEDVIWTSLTNTTTTPTSNDLKKTGGSDLTWDADAVSVQSIKSFKAGPVLIAHAGQTNLNIIVGLADTDPGTTRDYIDYAIYFNSSGNLYFFENGVSVSATYGCGTPAYTTSDIVEIRLNSSGYPQYVQNGTVLCTSTVLPTYPLFVDTSIYHSNASILDVKINSGYISPLFPDNIIIQSESTKQEHYYFQKGTSLTATATLFHNTNVGGVKFTLDGVTTINDTNTSDLNYSANFTPALGSHTMRTIILNSSLAEKPETEKIRTFFIVSEIWGFYGDSIMTGYYTGDSGSTALSNITSIQNSIDIIVGGTNSQGGRQSKNYLVYEQPDPNISDPNFTPGPGISFASLMYVLGNPVFVMNESKSGDESNEMTARWTSDGMGTRCTSVDGVSGNAALRGVDHAWIVFGINDKIATKADATFEVDLGAAVQKLLDCGIPASNIYVSYPTYSTAYNTTSYQDNIDNVIVNKNVKRGPNLWDYFNDHSNYLTSDGIHLTWEGYQLEGRLLARYYTDSDYWGDAWDDVNFIDWYGTEDYGFKGNIYLGSGESYYSPVLDLFSNKRIVLGLNNTMTQGVVAMYVRCSITEFLSTDSTPTWVLYSVFSAQGEVRWCQIKIAG